MAFIFLDESGQFKAKGEDYFVLASFSTDNPKQVEKSFRSWQHTKFPRVMRDQAEVKFAGSKISDHLRLKTLTHLLLQPIKVRYTYLKQKNIPSEYRSSQSIKSGSLYLHVVGELLEMHASDKPKVMKVVCDQRHLPELTQKTFSTQVIERVLPKLSSKVPMEVKMVDSTTNANIQVVDWIAGALAAYHNGKPAGKKYFPILEKRCAEPGKELFPTI